jgi:hypothetical protein
VIKPGDIIFVGFYPYGISNPKDVIYVKHHVVIAQYLVLKRPRFMKTIYKNIVKINFNVKNSVLLCESKEHRTWLEGNYGKKARGSFFVGKLVNIHKNVKMATLQMGY